MTHEDQFFQQPAPDASEERTTQTCPECGGVMTATRMGNLVEYRCHIGHRFGLRTLLEQNPDGEDPQELKEELQKRRREQELLRKLSATVRDPAQFEAD